MFFFFPNNRATVQFSLPGRTGQPSLSFLTKSSLGKAGISRVMDSEVKFPPHVAVRGFDVNKRTETAPSYS